MAKNRGRFIEFSNTNILFEIKSKKGKIYPEILQHKKYCHFRRMGYQNFQWSKVNHKQSNPLLIEWEKRISEAY